MGSSLTTEIRQRSHSTTPVAVTKEGAGQLLASVHEFLSTTNARGPAVASAAATRSRTGSSTQALISTSSSSRRSPRSFRRGARAPTPPRGKNETDRRRPALADEHRHEVLRRLEHLVQSVASSIPVSSTSSADRRRRAARHRPPIPAWFGRRGRARRRARSCRAARRGRT